MSAFAKLPVRRRNGVAERTLSTTGPSHPAMTTAGDSNDLTRDQPTAVVFDIGGVLLDVDQRYLYRELSDDEAAIKHFLATVCTADWNREQDRGRSEDVATEQLVRRHPDHEAWIRAFYGQHLRTIRGEIADTVACLRQLKAAGTPLFALSNWGRAGFRLVREIYDFLALFDDIVVSAHVGLCKPEREIYDLAMARFALAPQDILFIDDKAENLVPAADLGWATHHYRASDGLRACLRDHGLLPADRAPG